MADTLNQMFQESVKRFTSYPALSSKVDGAYKAISYGQLGEMVRKFASGLAALGVQKGDRLALISENRPEWAIADLGIIHLGAINVAIYPTLPAGQVQYIVADSAARVLIVSDQKQLDKALEIQRNLPDLHIITMDCPADTAKGVITFGGVMKLGESSPMSAADFEQQWHNVLSDEWASIIYTSGTTGDPKGAILTHRNFISSVRSAQEILSFHPGEALLSFVPLNHVMGRLTEFYLSLSCGAMVAYVESLRHLKQNMRDVKPHYMILVPRVFEMIKEGLQQEIAETSLFRQRLFRWAMAVGNHRYHQVINRQRVSLKLKLQWWLADRVFFSKIRQRLGLERLRYFISGSAPLSKSTAEFFYALGMIILEGYGLTETAALVSVNRPNRLRLGTVGPTASYVEVKIAEDGEILVRGPNITQGYYNKPSETAEAIDQAGWFHTGDIGQFDSEGFLKITDRKKDLIVLANGKKVAPQPIENRLNESPYVSQAILFGDRQNSVTALIVPAFERVREWARQRPMTDDLEDKAQLTKHKSVNDLVKEEIHRLCTDLADYEKIRNFTLLEHELSLEKGELTPTLKVKRHVVKKRYGELIDAMYRGH